MDSWKGTCVVSSSYVPLHMIHDSSDDFLHRLHLTIEFHEFTLRIQEVHHHSVVHLCLWKKNVLTIPMLSVRESRDPTVQIRAEAPKIMKFIATLRRKKVAHQDRETTNNVVTVTIWWSLAVIDAVALRGHLNLLR